MKAVKWFAPKDLRLVEVAKPTPKPYGALVRIESVGVCGSDLHYYADGAIGDTRLTQPVILGHEYAGIVEAVGAGADPDLVGRRVAVEPGVPCGVCEWCRSGRYNVCRKMAFPGSPDADGALCEYRTDPAALCFPVPDSVTAREAAMIEPLAVAVHSVELGRVQPGDTVAVFGLGPIGLLIAQVAKLAGASRVLGTDLLEYRVEVGARFGVDMGINAAANDTVSAILDATNGRGVDVAFDAARSGLTPGYACRVARPVGRCVLVGISGQSGDLFPVNEARRKELNVQWCRRFCHNFPRAIDLVSDRKVDVGALVTHSFPLERAQEAFDLACEGRDGVLKVSVDLE